MKVMDDSKGTGMDILDEFVNKSFIEKQLQYSKLYRYLDRYKNEELLLSSEIRKDDVSINKTIWIYWQQGMENAPQLVQRCYESVCRSKPDGFNVVLLSDENIHEYIQLPDYIWEKHEKGYISITHLSDLIRLELLCIYGGCWIDATVYCSDMIPKFMLSGKMFLFQLAAPECDPILKMSSWWIFSENDNELLHLARKMLLAYWERETDIRSYFLLHIVMSKMIDENPACRAIFYKIPYFNSGNAHVLQNRLGAEYDEEEWEIIKRTSCVHKLTYKKRYLQGDLYNYYMRLMDKGLK